MDKNTTFKYWLAVARHTSYKIGKQPRPAFVGEKQVPDNLNQLSIGQLIDLSQLSDSEESLYQIVTTVLGLSHKEVVAGARMIRAINQSHQFEPLEGQQYYETIIERLSTIVSGVMYSLQLTQSIGGCEV